VRAIHDSARGTHRFSYDAAHRLAVKRSRWRDAHVHVFPRRHAGRGARSHRRDGGAPAHRHGKRQSPRIRWSRQSERAPRTQRHVPADARRGRPARRDGGAVVRAMVCPLRHARAARRNDIQRTDDDLLLGHRPTRGRDPSGWTFACVRLPGHAGAHADDVRDYANVDADPESGKRYFVFRIIWARRRSWKTTRATSSGARGMRRTDGRTSRWAPTFISRCDAGHYLDAATGLHYVRFRYYSPGAGAVHRVGSAGISGGTTFTRTGTATRCGTSMCRAGDRVPEDEEAAEEETEEAADEAGVEAVEATRMGTSREDREGKLDRDHMPSFAAVKAAINEQRRKRGEDTLSRSEAKCAAQNLNALSMESGVHKMGRTYGNKEHK